MDSDAVRAHAHSIRHRDAVLASALCGCFYCCQTFTPTDVVKWTDFSEGFGRTALCPHCGIDSVIGSASGFPITAEFLAEMNERWF